MTMSSTKKKKSISEQINEVLKPRDLVEETDDNEARFDEFTEHDGIVNQLSDIRKQNAKSLSELDSKYKGKVVSRKELELEVEESSEDESLNGDNYATDSDESEESVEDGEEDVEENSEEDVEENSEDEEGSDEDTGDDDLGEDYDLSQFNMSQARPSASKVSGKSRNKNELLKDKSLDEEIQKGVCVQNQLKIWEKLLEVRIKSQKMLLTANALPDFDAHVELASLEDSTFSEKVERTCDGLHGLLDNLLELQSTLVAGFPESKDVFTNAKRKKDAEDTNNGFLKRSKLAEYSDKMEENFEDYKSFRNEVLQKWHERTRTAKDTKNPIANLNIMTKIENSLLGKNELIRKSQLYRGDYDIYGVDKPAENSDEKPDELHLPEIFDDSEFYHQLLRELIEYKSNTDENQSEITQKFIELQKVRSKMKKKVDTRASKGRKIRYIVHNKLVNYMPPNDSSDWNDEAKTELYSSLFGMANQGEKL